MTNHIARNYPNPKPKQANMAQGSNTSSAPTEGETTLADFVLAMTAAGIHTGNMMTHQQRRGLPSAHSTRLRATSSWRSWNTRGRAVAST